jgi:hypothetical protein
MSYLDTSVDGPAQADVNRIYVSDRARLGYLPNYTRVFGLRPAAEPDFHYRTSLEPVFLRVLTVGRPAEIELQRRATYPKRRVQLIS